MNRPTTLVIAFVTAVLAFVIVASAGATATRTCADVTINLGQPYWLFNGSPFVKANNVPTPLQPGQIVELDTFDTSNAAGYTVVPTVYNFASVRSGTTAHIGPVTISDTESQRSKTGAPFVAGNTVTIAVTLGDDPRQSIDQVSLTCQPIPTTSTTQPATTSTTSTPTTSNPTESSSSTTSTTSAPTTTAPASTSTSSTPPTSSVSTSTAPATTSTTTTAPATSTTTTDGPSPTTTTPTPSSTSPVTVSSPDLPPTGPGDWLPFAMLAGACAIALGWFLVRRTS